MGLGRKMQLGKEQLTRMQHLVFRSCVSLAWKADSAQPYTSDGRITDLAISFSSLLITAIGTHACTDLGHHPVTRLPDLGNAVRRQRTALLLQLGSSQSPNAHGIPPLTSSSSRLPSCWLLDDVRVVRLTAGTHALLLTEKYHSSLKRRSASAIAS